MLVKLPLAILYAQFQQLQKVPATSTMNLKTSMVKVCVGTISTVLVQEPAVSQDYVKVQLDLIDFYDLY